MKYTKLMIKKILTMIGMLMFLGTMAYAGQIKMDYAPGIYSDGHDGGGEFAAVTTGLGNFQTFCIERHVEFSPGRTYNYKITDGSPGNNISIGTAWLYSQFRDGTLEGYDYVYGYGRSKSATELQNAIWFLEDQGGYRDDFVTLAEKSLHLNDLGIVKDSNGKFGVVGLYLYDSHGNQAQNQLALVPDQASTLILFMLALFTIGIIKSYQIKYVVN